MPNGRQKPISGCQAFREKLQGSQAMKAKRIYKNKVFKGMLETMQEIALGGNAPDAVAIKSNVYFFIEGWCAAKRIKREDMEVIKKEVNQMIFDIIAKK